MIAKRKEWKKEWFYDYGYVMRFCACLMGMNCLDFAFSRLDLKAPNTLLYKYEIGV